MSDAKVVHLDRSQTHQIRSELLIVRQRLLNDRSADAEQLRRLHDLIAALTVPERPPERRLGT